MKKKYRLLWFLILIGFAAIEFPGIFYINRIEPRILGLPFIYGFTLIVWLYLCILMYVGYKLKWGFTEKQHKNILNNKTNSK
ncbi:hypothetical protein [Sinanaerobacter chloroacetimidivorans]|uniref:DUF3311 domain-containing protein n=1 Tax=Sinanaerobacter chloroacetimidivorans TaxID=2818044 RepID=A0A8J7W3D0_9FIRM|nr:hypothetical protein [Sinanaerobacter chloroacetimidivorans]MBR0598175.1 hypothetical protein [Sinanaerobacter chloroacetimidivorans]